MPTNAHDISSREIFSSAHGSFSISPESPEGRGYAVSARSTGPFVASEPSSAPASAGRSRQSALDKALGVVPRPAEAGVVPEKPSLTGGLKDIQQPGLSAPEQSPAASGREAPRSRSRALPPEKLVHSTIWLDPRVRAELEREAKAHSISLSEMGAIACREWVRYEIYRQQTTLFQEDIRQMVREEIRALKDSLIPFLRRSATEAARTDIVVTNLYQRVLTAEGVTTERFYELLDEADAMARDNVNARSPKFSAPETDRQAPSTASPQVRKEAAN